MNISQKNLWIIIGSVTGVVAIAIIVLVTINKINQPVQVAVPTLSVDQAIAEISQALTAEVVSATAAAATQTAMAPTATTVPTPSPEPPAGASQIWPIDGAEMMWIPSGPFWMGARDADEQAQYQEKPLHETMITGFWIDKELVTNGMYMRCVASGRCSKVSSHDDINPNYGKMEFANYPLVYVTWHQAKTYCEAVGRRLPTEAEWEKAARGTDGRIYPWGDALPNGELANYNNAFAMVQPSYLYAKGASPYGVLDMAGNTRQWVYDWFSDTYYGESAAIAVPVNPTGPLEGHEKVLRGGSFKDKEIYLRTTSRLKHEPSSAGDNRGFRCAFSDESPY